MNTDTKPFVCDCGLPAVRRTSNREPICERCSRLERELQCSIKQQVFAGRRQSGVLINTQLPLHHAVELPIVGGSLEILNRMLALPGVAQK